MSEATPSHLDAVASKSAAVWQPMPLLRNQTPKYFVRIQDERGHTAHFSALHYPQLSKEAMPHSPAPAVAATLEQAPVLTQAEHDPLDTQALQQWRQQAYDEGLAAGLAQAESEFKTRLDQQAQELLESSSKQSMAILTAIEQAMTQFKEQPHLRFEPLKRLALHLAEQLVLVELSASPQAIDALVQRCLDRLDPTVGAPVLIQLHPNDLELLKSKWADQLPAHWLLEPLPDLKPGSVVVSANDAVVQDLIEHRLSGLAHELLDQPRRWESQSAFSGHGLQQHQQLSKVQDVLAKEPSTLSTQSKSTSDAPLNPFAVSRQDLELNDLDGSAPAAPDEDPHHES